MARPIPWAIPESPTSVKEAVDASKLSGVLRLYWRGGSPRIIAAHLAVVAVARLFLAPPTIWDALVVAAVVVWWPVQEWLAHVALLHRRPTKHRLPIVGEVTIDPLAARVHRYHHRHPWVLETIFVPWPIVLALVPVHVLLWWAFTPSWSLAVTGMIAFAGMSLVYEWVHFIAHVPWRPRSRWMRSIQQHHRAHHFKNERYWHAFTVPALDRLFGTGPDPRKAPRSETCRTLGVVEDAEERSPE